jgi:hypothetical protein
MLAMASCCKHGLATHHVASWTRHDGFPFNLQASGKMVGCAELPGVQLQYVEIMYVTFLLV